MNIERVEIIPIQPKEGLIAFANIILDDALMLSGIGVHSRLNGGGYRITYPTRKVNNTHHYLFRPLISSLSHEIEEAISAKGNTIFKF